MSLPRRNLQFSFTPRLVPTLAALVVLGLTLYLATWQRDRADEKRGLQAQYERRINLSPLPVNNALAIDAQSNYRNAIATGEYDAAGQFFVDNKSEGALVGFHVFTPLRLANDSRYLLVNRGFVARGSTYPTPPAVTVPTGLVEIIGMLVSPTKKFLELGDVTMPAPNSNNKAGAATRMAMATSIRGDVWQNITIERYREHSQRDVLSLILLANPTDAGLSAQAERPDARVEKHIEYMLTWYSLSATVVILWLVLNFKFNRPLA